jgi:hypothetical protein
MSRSDRFAVTLAAVVAAVLLVFAAAIVYSLMNPAPLVS